jgi:hypothetical protein
MIRPLRTVVPLGLALAVAAAANPRAGSRQQAASPPPLARVIWLEDAGDRRPEAGQLPVYRGIDPQDARLKDYERWIDTEAARFARRLLYRAAQRFGADPIFRDPALPVVIRKGGNNGAYGLAIATSRGVEEHPKLPYIILDPSPTFLGDTILHESGHLVHSLAQGRRHDGSRWSAFPHTTFATSDPLTALAEGYAIHFETLCGHFGAEAAKQAYYRRLAPSFEAGRGRNAEYFSPVDDLMTFAQVWSRYQGVRDGLPALEGHLYPGAYPRTQMDPARDRARLKTPNAMLASEGVAASVLFWISAALAGEHGARPGGGLDQPGVADAEMILLEALAPLPPPDSDAFRPDMIDVVEALGRANPHVGDIAISRFVDITRGVTARPAIRERWHTLYDAAIMLDFDMAKPLVAQMDVERGEIVTRARQDISTLRAGIGPVIPVRVKGATFELKALGERMPIEFDLNGMSEAEMALLPALNADARARIARERERAPFASAADFASRAGCTLEQMGLLEVPLKARRTPAR